MDVMVSEPSGAFRRWADQWRAADEHGRGVLVFRPRGGEERVRAQAPDVYETAAVQAGPGGTVVVSVGHGASAGDGEVVGDTTIGMVDLAPRRALRIQRDNVFYDDQRRSDRITLNAYQQIGRDRCRRLGRRRSHLVGQEAFDLTYCDGAPWARERLAIRRAYDSIGRSFRTHRVASVVLLACRVGNATAFLDAIATDWGVAVTAYRRRVAAGQDSGGQYRVYLLGDDEGEGTNHERARTQLPRSDRYTASARSQE